MGAKELIVIIEQMLTQAKSLEPKDTADAFALIQENANDFVALVREQRKTREEKEPPEPPTVLEIYIAYAAVSKFKSLPEKDKIQRACGYLGIKEQEFSLPKIEYKYAPLYDAWNAAKVRPLASHNLAEQERGFALNEFGTLLNQGLSDSKTAEFNVARKKRLALLGLNLADDRGASHFFDQGIPLSTSVLSIKRPADIENWFRECNERSAPTESSLDDKINSQIEQNLFNQFERDVIPHLGTPKQDEAIRLFLQGRSDRFSKTGYTGAPYSLINRFCVGLALTLIDPADPTPNKALWNIVLPEVQGVHGNGNSTDWPAYGEVLLDDNLVSKQPGQLWSYPLLLSISQSVPCFGVLHGKPASDFERMSPSEQWIMESLKGVMPSEEVLKRVYLFNEKHSDFWSAQQLTLQPQRATPNLLEFFQDLNQLFAKYKKGNAGAEEMDIGNEGNDAALPFQMTCAVLLSTKAYSKMLQQTGLQEIMSNIVNPGIKYKDTRSCFMQNHGKLSAILSSSDTREYLASWDNVAADFLLAPANDSLTGTDKLSHDATQLLYQLASTLSREELTDAINQLQPDSKDLPVLLRAFDERLSQQEDKDKISFLFNVTFQLKENKRDQFLSSYFADDFQRLKSMLSSSHSLKDYALALQLLNLNSHRDLIAPIAEFFLSRLSDATYQWNDVDKTTIKLVLRETDLSPYEFESRFFLASRAPGILINELPMFIAFLNRTNAADVRSFFSTHGDYIFNNLLWRYSQLKDTLSALSEERRAAVLQGFGTQISRMISSKSELLEILSLVPKDVHASFLNDLGQKGHDLIVTSDEIMSVKRLLSQKGHVDFIPKLRAALPLLQSDAVFQLVCSTLSEEQENTLSRAMDYIALLRLSEEDMAKSLAELGTKVLTLLDGVPQRFFELLDCVPSDKALAFVLNLGEPGKELAINNFSTFVFKLGSTSLMGLVEFIGNKLPQVDTDFYTLYKAISKLPPEKRVFFIKELSDKRAECINTAMQIGQILSLIPGEERYQAFNENFSTFEIKKGTDLKDIIANFSDAERSQFLVGFGREKIIASIQNGLDFSAVLKCYPIAQRKEFFTRFGLDNVITLLKSDDELIGIMAELSPDHRMEFLDQLKAANKLQELIVNSSSINSFAFRLDEATSKHLIEQIDLVAVVRDSLPIFIHYCSPSMRDFCCTILGKELHSIITWPSDLSDVVGQFDVEEALPVAMQQAIAELLAKPEQLGEALNRLYYPRWKFYDNIINTLLPQLNTSKGLADVLMQLSSENQQHFLSRLEERIDFMTDASALIDFLQNVPEYRRYEMLKIFSDKIHSMIKNSSELAQVLALVPSFDNNDGYYRSGIRQELMEVFGAEAIRPWIQTRQDLECIVNVLEQADAEYFITMLNLDDEALQSLIQSNSILVTVLNTKPSQDRIAFIQSLGIERINALMQNGHELVLVMGTLSTEEQKKELLGITGTDIIANADELIEMVQQFSSWEQYKYLESLNDRIKNSMDLNKVLRAFSGAQDTILKSLGESRLAELINDCDALITLVDGLTETHWSSNRYQFLVRLESRLGTLIQNNDQLISLLEKLPVDQRYNLVIHLGSKVSETLTSSSELIAFLSTVSTLRNPEQMATLTSLLAPKIDALIQTPEQLVQALALVSLAQVHLFSDKMTVMFADASVLGSALAQLSPVLQCAVLSVAGGQRFDLIRNADDLIKTLSKLDEVNQRILMGQLGGSVLIHIKNSDDFVKILRSLKESAKREFIIGPARDISYKLMTDLKAAIRIGGQFPEDWKADLVSYCAPLINQMPDLLSVLSIFYSNAQVYGALSRLGSDKLNSLQWNDRALSEVLNNLPLDKIQNFIQLLNPQHLYVNQRDNSVFKSLHDRDTITGFIMAMAPIDDGRLLRHYAENILRREDDPYHYREDDDLNIGTLNTWLLEYYTQVSSECKWLEGDVLNLTLDNFAQLFKTQASSQPMYARSTAPSAVIEIQRKLESLAKNDYPLPELREFLLEKLKKMPNERYAPESINNTTYPDENVTLIQKMLHSIAKIDAILARQEQLEAMVSQTPESVPEHIARQRRIKSSVDDLRGDDPDADNDRASTYS